MYINTHGWVVWFFNHTLQLTAFNSSTTHLFGYSVHPVFIGYIVYNLEQRQPYPEINKLCNSRNWFRVKIKYIIAHKDWVHWLNKNTFDHESGNMNNIFYFIFKVLNKEDTSSTITDYKFIISNFHSITNELHWQACFPKLHVIWQNCKIIVQTFAYKHLFCRLRNFMRKLNISWRF